MIAQTRAALPFKTFVTAVNRCPRVKRKGLRVDPLGPFLLFQSEARVWEEDRRGAI